MNFKKQVFIHAVVGERRPSGCRMPFMAARADDFCSDSCSALIVGCSGFYGTVVRNGSCERCLFFPENSLFGQIVVLRIATHKSNIMSLLLFYKYHIILVPTCTTWLNR